MQHHPHLHVVIPAVVLDARGKLLRFPAKPDFHIHGTPLAIRFRNRLELALKTDLPQLHALLLEQHPQVFCGNWVADVLHTGVGQAHQLFLGFCYSSEMLTS